MLSLFPELLFLAPLAAFLIRMSLSVLLAYEGWRHVSGTSMSMRIAGIGEIGVALALLIGAWTQVFALGTAGVLIASLFMPRYRTYPKSTVALAIIMALSLIVTGAGPFAFDLPL